MGVAEIIEKTQYLIFKPVEEIFVPISKVREVLELTKVLRNPELASGLNNR